jgi:twinkle protein
MASVIERDSIDWAKYERETEFQAKVRPANVFGNDLIEALRNPQQALEGDTLPWGKTHAEVRLRRGELSLWMGFNGHRKSMLLGQVMLQLMADKKRCLIASFEMRPVATLNRMLRQASGGASPSVQFAQLFNAWLKGRLWIFDHMGNVKPERAIALCRYAREELGIDHLVLDSMMKIISAEDAYTEQKSFIGQLHSLVQETGMHVHLIHHARKPDGTHGERNIPTRYDMKGSGAISDQADNVFSVWADKEAEEKRRKGTPTEGTAPDSILAVLKQRHGEFEGRVALWFDRGSLQFRPFHRAPPFEYVK